MKKETKKIETELKIETPIGDVKIDLGEIAKIQAAIEAEANKNQFKPKTMLESFIESYVGKKYDAFSNYYGGNLGPLMKIHTDKFFKGEWELVKEFNLDEVRGIEIPCVYESFPRPGGLNLRYLDYGFRLYQHKTNGEYCILQHLCDSDGDSRLRTFETVKSDQDIFGFVSGNGILDDLVEDFYVNGPLKNTFFDLKYNFLDLDLENHELLCLDEQVERELNENIILFQRLMPKLFQKGLPNSRGVILAGPPGTGKTLITKWLASQLEITRILVSAEMLFNKHDIKDVYEIARKLSPTLLFIEDIDTVGTLDRAISDHPLLGEFLQAMDGVVPNHGVITVATTNHTENIDPAIADRPGRFDRIIEIDLPTRTQRKGILEKLLKKLEVDTSVNEIILSEIAKNTELLSGAWLRELVHTALIQSIAHEREEICAADLEFATCDVMKRRGMAYRPIKNTIRIQNLDKSPLFS